MIVLKDLTYSFHEKTGEPPLLDGINIEIPTNRRFGILGAPRSGKTVLMKLLAGLEEATSGSISRFAHLSFPLAYEGIFRRHMSVRENLEQFRHVFGEKIDSIVSFVEAVIEVGHLANDPLGDLPSELQKRFILAAGYALPFDCYLIDERFTTSPSDEIFRTKCITMLETRASQNGIIMASNRVNIIQRFCDTAAILYGGKLHRFDTVKEAAAAFSKGTLASI